MRREKSKSAVLVFQDITERKLAEAELAGYQKQLEALVKARTDEVDQVNERLQQRIKWLSIVNAIHQSITGVASLESAFEKLSASILELTGASLVFVLRWEDVAAKSEIVNFSMQGEETLQLNNLKDLFQKGSPLRQEIDTGNFMTWTEDQANALPELFRKIFEGKGISIVNIWRPWSSASRVLVFWVWQRIRLRKISSCSKVTWSREWHWICLT